MVSESEYGTIGEMANGEIQRNKRSADEGVGDNCMGDGIMRTGNMRSDALFNGSQHPQCLVPPSTRNTIGLDILLLIMLSLLLTLIIRMLYSDVCLDFTTGSLEAE